MRLFLALDLPERTRVALTGWRDAALAGSEELRPVPAQGLHLTLVFLGWTAAEAVSSVWRATTAAAAGRPAPLLAAAGVLAVPRRRPRLLALDLADEDCRAGALSTAVAAALGDAGLHQPELRPFWPHVTLARLRRGGRARPLAAEPPALAPFSAAALTLYRSDPSRAGARYTALEQVELGL